MERKVLRWNSMRGRLAAAGLALLVLGAPLAAAARSSGSPIDLVARHAQRLGLDDETQQAIARVAEESAARQEALWEEVRAARERLHALLVEGKEDRDAVMQEAARVDALKAEAHRDRLDAVLRIHALLTPAQRQELVRIHEEHGPRRRYGCEADLAALCPDAPPGPEALGCLADHFDALSEACRRSLGRLSGEGPPRGSKGRR